MPRLLPHFVFISFRDFYHALSLIQLLLHMAIFSFPGYVIVSITPCISRSKAEGFHQTSHAQGSTLARPAGRLALWADGNLYEQGGLATRHRLHAVYWLGHWNGQGWEKNPLFGLQFPESPTMIAAGFLGIVIKKYIWNSTLPFMGLGLGRAWLIPSSDLSTKTHIQIDL